MKRILLTAAIPTLFSTGLIAQENLPKPDTRFKGDVGITYKSSDPAQFPQPIKPPKGAPNVLLVLLDDVGFGQFSVSGGGVPSPSMEKLFNEGIMYNRFHTTALCSPTRAALITGRNHHTASTAIITELATGYDGYTGTIPRSTATIGEILRLNGYATAWFGKNHNTPNHETGPLGPFNNWPNGLGFDYFYGFMGGDINQIKPNLYLNQNPQPMTEDPNFDLSTDLCDKTITYLQGAEAFEPDKPWFVYLAPAATHNPHQVSKEWIDKFKGKFDMGWDEYREQTFERQKELGIIPANTKLTPRPEGLAAWSSLNADQKKVYTRMMEVYAAFGANADYQVGRVLDYVKTLPDADNTVIIYILGDNGASAEGLLDGTTNEVTSYNGVSETYQQILPYLDELGTVKHFNHFPSAWAWAMNSPFQWTKQIASHLGGVRNPMIVSWPAKIKERHAVRDQFTHVTDIAPTILEIVGIEEPYSVNGIAQKPMEGKSFAATFANADAKSTHNLQYFEMFSNRGIYQNGWWASCIAYAPWIPTRTEFDPLKAKWELYNLDEDFSQANDLAATNPAKLEELKALWWAQAGKYNVIPMDWRGVERFSGTLTGKPNPANGRTHFVYVTPINSIPEATAPDLKNVSFSISADVDIKANANGMIFTQGGNTAGWGFYILKGKLYFTHNYIDLERYTIISNSTIPAGKHTVKVEFAYDGASPKDMGKGGSVELFVDGKKVGEGKVAKTTPMKYTLSETQDIGIDMGTPIDNNYDSPLQFEGKLSNVVVDIK